MARDLLHELRPSAVNRSPIDPGLAGGLRAWLEDGALPVAAKRPDGTPMELHPWNLGAGRGAEGRARPTSGATASLAPRVHLAMVRTVFRLTVTGVPPSRPFEDALSALSVEDWGAAILDVVRGLGRWERADLRHAVRSDAEIIASAWSTPPPAWLPRTRERLCVPLAGGAVLLGATADLVLGAPEPERASVCSVSVYAGSPIRAHAGVRRFLALLETVRSGTPPLRVATYHTSCGRLVAQDVTDELLASAVGDVLDALRRERTALTEVAA